MEVFHDDEKVGRGLGYLWALIGALYVASVCSLLIWVLS